MILPDESTFEVGRKRTYPSIPIPKEVRSLLEFCNPTKFKQMSDEEMAKHIMENREKIEMIAPWPCLAWYGYLPHSPKSIRKVSYPKVYERVVNELKNKKEFKLLDMAGLIGLDLRCLIQDGVKPDQLVCADLMSKLFKVGLDLFADSFEDEHLKGSQWKHVDIFKPELVDSIRIPNGYHAIYASKFIHLFSWDKQKEVLKILFSLLSKERGSTLFGSDSGRKEGEEGVFDYKRAKMTMGSIENVADNDDNGKDTRPSDLFHHSCNSFRTLIREVEREEKIEGAFKLEIELHSFDPPKGDGEFVVNPNFTISMRNSIAWSLTRN